MARGRGWIGRVLRAGVFAVVMRVVGGLSPVRLPQALTQVLRRFGVVTDQGLLAADT